MARPSTTSSRHWPGDSSDTAMALTNSVILAAPRSWASPPLSGPKRSVSFRPRATGAAGPAGGGPGLVGDRAQGPVHLVPRGGPDLHRGPPHGRHPPPLPADPHAVSPHLPPRVHPGRGGSLHLRGGA